MSYDMSTNNIRIARKAKGLTMKELGARVGVAESTISQYENGKRQPNNATLLKLAEELSTTVDYLLGEENSGLSDFERAILDGYHAAPEHIKKAVDILLEVSQQAM